MKTQEFKTEFLKMNQGKSVAEKGDRKRVARDNTIMDNNSHDYDEVKFPAHEVRGVLNIILSMA